ncbi:MAG: kinase [Flammeovirgaceae bacterium]|nr:kinase [Flammeovirgaceae bacterium]|tara:strand:- start:674 stop:1669 length:996 start_codon:yes stop_codon:yes gene_type:complete
MIIVKTPYRISFFGGGTDYPNWFSHFGGGVISATINKHIYLSIRNRPGFFQKKNRIIYSKTEEVNNFSEIRLNPIKQIFLKERIRNGLEFHYDGELPARSGIGSSSAFVVGLAQIISLAKKQKFNKKSIAKKAIYYERKVLKESVGVQDQIACAYGGLNYIKIKKDGNFEVKNIFKNTFKEKKLSDKLILVYTGLQKINHSHIKKYVKDLKKKKKTLLETMKLTDVAYDLIIKNQYNDFGRLLNETWKLKKETSSFISNYKIDKIYEEALNNGAVGGKLLGAGGGGFLLFYVNKDKKNFLKKKLKNFLVFDVCFENSGTKLIYMDKNEKFV